MMVRFLRATAAGCACALLGLFVLQAPVSVAAPDPCRAGPFRVAGQIRNASGRGVPDTRVFLLLDRASGKKFAQQGVRAKSVETDAAGFFDGVVVCGTDPDPCAKRPKHLTAAVSGSRSAMKLKVFRLGDLDTDAVAGECRIRLPDIAFSP
jgi:hypothetical protein